MNKKIVSLCLCICIVLIICSVFVGCNNKYIKTYSVTYDLNGGSWTEEFKQSKSMESNNLISIINALYYEGATRTLPKYGDINAPSGKIFAGWYIDQDYKKPWTEGNFNAYMAEFPETTNIRVHAKWINAGSLDVVYYVKNTSTSFTSDSLLCRVVNVSHSSTADQVLSTAPSVSQMAPIDGFEFKGWVESPEALQTQLDETDANNGQVMLNAKWKAIPMVTLSYDCTSYIDDNGEFQAIENCPVWFNGTDYNSPRIRRDLITAETLTQATTEFESCLELNEGYESYTISKWMIAEYNMDTGKYELKEYTVSNIVEYLEGYDYLTDWTFTLLPVYDA